MGTPAFAVESLDILFKNDYDIVGVITAPDKPAGRGQKLQQSAVKEYAVNHHLNVLQPEKLKNPDFLEELKALKADLQIVVAFRMLPEVVWNMPRLGTFNLHASLLPQYRGAAPINWAVINGEKETGVTTFFLQHEIDTGKIIFTEKTPIGEDESATELHDRLMHIGAGLVLKTVQAIEKGDCPQTAQDESLSLKHAPKIFREDCRINWEKDVFSIHNHIRGLSAYPAAWTEIQSPEGEIINVKVYRSFREINSSTFFNPFIQTDGKTFIKVPVKGGYIHLEELQLAGKKRMKTEELLRGFRVDGWKVV